jgi:hypothetical protein
MLHTILVSSRWYIRELLVAGVATPVKEAPVLRYVSFVLSWKFVEVWACYTLIGEETGYMNILGDFSGLFDSDLLPLPRSSPPRSGCTFRNRGQALNYLSLVLR